MQRASDFVKLSQYDHILTRPDSYVGSVERTTERAWVVEEDGRAVQRDVTHTPALLKIFDEVLVNACDNKQRDPKMNRLDVDIVADPPKITVFNNGAGIPVEPSECDPAMLVPEMIFGELLTSSNFEDGTHRTVGGRNGYGAKLTNIFSTEFTVETCDGTRKFSQRFSNNKRSRTKPKVTACKTPSTRITFCPDMARLGGGGSSLDADTMALLRRRVYDVAGALQGGVKVHLNGEVLPVKNFQEYVSLFSGRARDECVFERCGDRWQIAVTASDGAFQQVSFVNAIATSRGGTHVAHVTEQITAALVAQIKTKHKADKVDVKPAQVKHQLFVFVNALIEDPKFDSQTKETLTSRVADFGSRCVIPDGFYRKVASKTRIMDLAASVVRSREAAALAKTDGKAKKSRITGIPKLEDAELAGTKRSSECTLILTEGDSAKALAVAGFTVVGRQRYGVFPLRGKLVNPRAAEHGSILKNEEFVNLKTILGLVQGAEYTDTHKLRYGHVMIMTDQDPDGSHIKGLVINVFHYYWPSLLRLPGFLCEFVTPIVKSRGESFFTLQEYRAWAERHPGAPAKYYKGLGTSSTAEAKAYFGALARHKLDFVWAGDADGERIDMAFNKKRADDRKAWLRASAGGDEVYVDHTRATLPFAEFVDKELVHFSSLDNHRSIPSMVDGLKPGQRKILFACFKRRLADEIKVAQLAGYVAEHSAYHHGETSLAATIVGMAQTFVGSNNNINLLFPSGQFGTRAQGGKDAASARYIFTRLEAITRTVFPEEDDPLLEYLDDDGKKIEPKHYVPIIPLVLCNGADGIGTGWSTHIPPHDPRAVVANIRKLLAEEEPAPMQPWFRGFRGRVVARGEGGSANPSAEGHAVLEDATLTITELPPGVWTQTYKEWLEKQIPTLVTRYTEKHTDAHVHFVVELTPAGVAKASGPDLLPTFKLRTSIPMGNMHLFDANMQIARYASAEDIVRAFFPIRMELYVRRRAHILNRLEHEVCILDNKVRFILEVVNGTIVVARRPRKDLEAELRRKKYSEKKDNDGGGGGGYNYLLCQPLWALTAERVAELEALRTLKRDEHARMTSTDPKDLWLHDLNTFERMYNPDIEEPPPSATTKRKRAPPKQKK